MLVEDDAVIGALLVEILSGLGHEVCAIAVTESEAIEAAARHSPDLMIVNANLQTGSGVSAMDAILRLTAMPHVFMTGGSRQTIPPQATVLRKPFGIPALTAALDRVAGQVEALDGGSAHVEP